MSLSSEHYDVQEYPINNTTIGYIIRWKNTPKWKQISECHHAEFILPGGEIVAYGYDAGQMAAHGNCYQRTFEKGTNGVIRSSTPDAEKKISAAFLDYKKSIKFEFRSSVILIEVNKFLAKKVENFWHHMDKKYNKYFHNCSTVCYFAFREINLIPRLFPEIISPERLFQHLIKSLKQQSTYSWMAEDGYIGLKLNKYLSNKNNLVIAKKKAFLR